MHRTVLLTILLASLSLTFQAQTDSTEYETFDIVYLTGGGLLKGEILSFDEREGGLVFKDTLGRKHFLSKDEYEYFVEDRQFPVRKKRRDRDIPLRERKESGMEIMLGFDAAYLGIRDDFTDDDYFMTSAGNIGDTPLSLKVGVGKYFDRQNYLGLTSDIALYSESSNYFNAGLRYCYQYDGNKNNVAFNIPIELKFNTMSFDFNYQVNDTIFDNSGGFSWPRDEQINISQNSLVLNFGQGISFITSNKRSVALEAAVIKHFILSEKFRHDLKADPQSAFSITGVRFSLIYNI